MQKQWVISVMLDEVDYESASKWMDIIENAVFQYDPKFSGIIAMNKEEVEDE